MTTNKKICHWAFDEGSGALVNEAVSGTTNCVAGVFESPEWRDGVSGSALMFDGYSNFFECEQLQLEAGRSFSISVWVAPRVLEHGYAGKLSAIVNQFDEDARTGFVLGLGKLGRWAAAIGDGNTIRQADVDVALQRGRWSHLCVVHDAHARRLDLFLNGGRVASLVLGAEFEFVPAETPLTIGRTVGNATRFDVFPINTYSGLLDDLVIFDEALDPGQVNALCIDAAVGTQADVDLNPAVFDGDRHRPRFHAIVPGHWMNEPHAPFGYAGRYHLFCQHNPLGPYFHQLRWGHWVSENLVNWRFVGEALSPDEALAPDGVWSGSATYDEHGQPVLFFTAANKGNDIDQAIGMARPSDISDPNLADWNKHPQLVVEQDECWGLTKDFRDPFVWRDAQSGDWYMLVGSGDRDSRRGRALVFSSSNLVEWTHLGDFFPYDEERYPEIGPVWELPVFLPIGKYPDGEDKYIFMVSPVGEGADVEVFYWLGRFDRERASFRADQDAPRLIDYGDFHFTGPSGMIDPESGRVLLFTIAQGERTEQEEHDAGWAHNAGLPVVLSLDKDGELLVDPVEELATLRNELLVTTDDTPVSETNELLEKVNGRMLEIQLEVDLVDVSRFCILVGATPDRDEQTAVIYDVETETISVDRSKTRRSQSLGIQGGPLELTQGKLKLQIFIDHSMLEVYANSKQSITTRMYSDSPDATHMHLAAPRDIRIARLRVWCLGPIEAWSVSRSEC